MNEHQQLELMLDALVLLQKLYPPQLERLLCMDQTRVEFLLLTRQQYLLLKALQDQQQLDLSCVDHTNDQGRRRDSDPMIHHMAQQVLRFHR